MDKLKVSDTITLNVTPDLKAWGGTFKLVNNSEYNVIRWDGEFYLPKGVTISGTNVSTIDAAGGGINVRISSPSTYDHYIKHGESIESQWLELSIGDENLSTLIDNLNPKFEGVIACPPMGGGGIPNPVFAPYVDVLAYSTSSPYYTSGYFSLYKCFQKSKQLYYTLAFVVAHTPNDGKAYWGGTVPVDSYYYCDQIDKIRENGGDVIVSFGGENGTPLAAAITEQDALVKAYQDVIDKLRLTYIDFDIEGAAVSETKSITRRSQAIAELQQKNPNLKVSYTLPVNPDGLPEEEENIISSAKEHGVNLDCINIMAMDFGPEQIKSGVDMHTYIEKAADSLYSQLKEIYQDKTEEQIWSMIGITPMIGYNDVRKEIVEINDAQEVTDWAIKKNAGRLSMWSSNRDNYAGNISYTSPMSSGIRQKDFQFTGIFNKIMQK